MLHQKFKIKGCPEVGYKLRKYRADWEIVYWEEYNAADSWKNDLALCDFGEEDWQYKITWEGECQSCGKYFTQETKADGYIQRHCYDCSDDTRFDRVKAQSKILRVVKQDAAALEAFVRKTLPAVWRELPQRKWDKRLGQELRYWADCYEHSECTFNQAVSKIADVLAIAAGDAPLKSIGALRMTGFGKMPFVPVNLLIPPSKKSDKLLDNYAESLTTASIDGAIDDDAFDKAYGKYDCYFAQCQKIDDIL